MNIVETGLIYGGVPAGLAALLVAGVYGRTVANPGRYRPGRQWANEPVWYLPRVDALPALTPASSAQHLTGGPALVPGAGAGAPVDGAVGGASGEW